MTIPTFIDVKLTYKSDGLVDKDQNPCLHNLSLAKRIDKLLFKRLGNLFKIVGGS